MLVVEEVSMDTLQLPSGNARKNKKGQIIIACDLQHLAVLNTGDYLTIIPRARMGSESIAH